MNVTGNILWRREYFIILQLFFMNAGWTIMTIGWGKTFAMSSYSKLPPRNLWNTNIKPRVNTCKYSFFSVSFRAMLKSLFIKINNIEKGWERPPSPSIWPNYLTSMLPTLFFKAKATGQTKIIGRWIRTHLKTLG